MELKNIFGEVFFALGGAKTILELVTAAVAANREDLVKQIGNAVPPHTAKTLILEALQ